jgi:hypothetical protein
VPLSIESKGSFLYSPIAGLCTQSWDSSGPNTAPITSSLISSQSFVLKIVPPLTLADGREREAHAFPQCVLLVTPFHHYYYYYYYYYHHHHHYVMILGYESNINSKLYSLLFIIEFIKR